MKRVSRLGVACGLALAATACGGSAESEAPGSFPPAAYETVASETGKLSIELRTSPQQPLDRGLVSVLYTVTGPDRAPVDGLQIAITPWMPAMAHGSSLRPTVSAEGRGRYVIGNLGLFMPGLWQLRTSISGAVDDRVTVAIEVR